MIKPEVSHFDAISPTALLVAYARQFTDISYSRDIAHLVNAQRVVEQLLGKQWEQLAEMAVLIEARYKAINQLMMRFEPTQVIELASGLLPRGIVMSHDPAITFVESDLPIMIDRKHQWVNRLIGDRPNLHFAAVDVTRYPNPFDDCAKYLSSTKPVVMLCEGLLMYLTFPEKQQVFANIHETLKLYGGVWITADLITKEDSRRLREASGSIQRLDQALQAIAGRGISHSHFVDRDHLLQFADEQGFCVEEFSLLNVIDQLTCLEPLRINFDVAKAMVSTRSIFALTLKST